MTMPTAGRIDPADSQGFITDKHGVCILDAAGLDVLKAFRYFTSEAGDPPVIVAALLTVAWVIKGR